MTDIYYRECSRVRVAEPAPGVLWLVAQSAVDGLARVYAELSVIEARALALDLIQMADAAEEQLASLIPDRPIPAITSELR